MSWQTFWEGMGSVLVVAPRRAKPKWSYQKRSVSEVLAEDWQKVGGSLRTAIRKFEEENKP